MRWAAYLMTVLALALSWLLVPSAAVGLALGLVLALPVASLALALFTRKKVRLELKAPAVAQKGRPLELELRRVCGARLPLGRIRVRVHVENAVTGERIQRTAALNDQARWTIASRRCGCLRVTAQRARLYDLLGLLWVPISVGKPLRVVVMPDTFPVEIPRELSPAPMHDCEDYAPDRRGQDRSETFQIRPYVPGDGLTQIHWKLSSKLDKLMVREPSLPVDQSLMVFVDRSWGDISPDRADAIMEAAVSVCQALSEDAVSFRLVWNQENIELRDVSDPDQLPEAVGALLKSRTPAQALSGPEVYLGLFGPVNAGRIICIGAAIPECLEEFSGGSPVLSLLCTDGAAVDGAVCFTPENAAEVLSQLSWS